MSVTKALAHMRQIIEADAPAASAGTALTGDVIDTAGAEGANFVFRVGTGDAGNSAKIQGSPDGSTAWTDLTGATVALTGNYAEICVHKPRQDVHRHLRSVVTRSGADTTLDSAICELYGQRTEPVAPASGITQTVVTSPVAA